MHYVYARYSNVSIITFFFKLLMLIIIGVLFLLLILIVVRLCSNTMKRARLEGLKIEEILNLLCERITHLKGIELAVRIELEGMINNVKDLTLQNTTELKAKVCDVESRDSEIKQLKGLVKEKCQELDELQTSKDNLETELIRVNNELEDQNINLGNIMQELKTFRNRSKNLEIQINVLISLGLIGLISNPEIKVIRDKLETNIQKLQDIDSEVNSDLKPNLRQVVIPLLETYQEINGLINDAENNVMLGKLRDNIQKLPEIDLDSSESNKVMIQFRNDNEGIKLGVLDLGIVIKEQNEKIDKLNLLEKDVVDKDNAMKGCNLQIVRLTNTVNRFTLDKACKFICDNLTGTLSLAIKSHRWMMTAEEDINDGVCEFILDKDNRILEYKTKEAVLIGTKADDSSDGADVVIENITTTNFPKSFIRKEWSELIYDNQERKIKVAEDESEGLLVPEGDNIPFIGSYATLKDVQQTLGQKICSTWQVITLPVKSLP